MKIEYRIKEYFEKNKLIGDEKQEGIIIHQDGEELLIEGTTGDLVELADLIVNVAVAKTKGVHIHIDQNTLLSENSDIKEIIIQKSR